MKPGPGRRQGKRLDLKNGRVEMFHGAGGRAMADLIDLMFRSAFSNELLDAGNDQATFELPPGRVVMTTDSYVISPLFFPGGDIGSLAVHGTINDLAMGGAVPKYLTAGFIIEEGFPLSDLDRIAQGMASAANEAGVSIVTGDTKVVERGKGDGVFINTAGVGVAPADLSISGELARPGDRIIVSGTIGDHGVAIMSHRQGLQFETTIESDSASLAELVQAITATAGNSVHVLRDPTRGGLAATLNEIAQQSGVGMLLEETLLPIREEVRGACDLLGLDPLNVANEGKLIAIVSRDAAPEVLKAMREINTGTDAAIIGEVTEDPMRLVRMQTGVGGERVVDWLHGEQLPRIC